MRRATFVLVLSLAFAGSVFASQAVAQDDAPLAADEGAVSLAQPEADAEEATDGNGSTFDEPEVWQGPRVELGFTHYVLSDGLGAGSVNAASFGGFLPLGWPRIGASIEAGVRSYAKGQDDFLGRGNLMLGYQHLGLDRFLPYITLVGTMGPLLGKRFDRPVSHLLYGVGVEVGADVNIVRSFFAGLAFSYIRASMWDLSYDLFIFKVSVGL